MKKKQIQIDQMKTSDIASFVALGKKTGLGMAEDARETYEMDQMIKQNPNSCFTTKVNGQIIGMIFAAYNGRRAWIYHLAVDPNWQHNGIGSLLLKKAESALKYQGVTKIILGVHVSNLKTVGFYEKNGFEVAHDAVLMEKDLFVRGGDK